MELDEFGKALMTQVRDESILNWQSILSGKMRGETAAAANKVLSESRSPQEAIELLLPDIVNTVLHRLMEFAELQEVQLLWKGTNIAEASDGLGGELATPRGWIARYSITPKGQMAK